MLLSQPKNACKHISFPFLSDAYKISSCCFKKEHIFTRYTHVNRKFHHHSTFEIHFVLDGRLVYEADDKTINLEKGQILLLLPKTNHRIVDVSEKVVKCSLMLSFGDINNKAILKNLSGHKVYKGKITEDIYEGLQYLAEAKPASETNGPLTISAKAYALICSLPFSFFDSKIENMDDDTPDVRLADAKQYIKDNLVFNITCTQVAQHCYLSVKQLSRIFLKYEGITLMQYITNVKTEAAEQLLMDSDISLKEISERLGFCNEYYFNTFFKKNAGMSPGDYRKSFR